MKQLALSIEQMKHLQELGLDTSDASMYWEYKGQGDEGNYYNLEVLDFSFKELWPNDIPTYTLQDILKKLPDYIMVNHNVYYYEQFINGYGYKAIRYGSETQNIQHCETSNEHVSLLEASYKMLCWCIENGYIKLNKN